MALNPKQEAFCLEYLKDFNGTQSAIRAGYSKRTANEQSAQLLAKLSIQERIKQLRDKTTAETILSVVERKEMLSELSRSSEPKDAIKAIDTLNKMDGVYTQKVEHTGNGLIQVAKIEIVAG